MNREQLIDTAERFAEELAKRADWQYVERLYTTCNIPEDDSDEDEGFYATMSDNDIKHLVEVLFDDLCNNFEGVTFTKEQFDLVKDFVLDEALEDEAEEAATDLKEIDVNSNWKVVIPKTFNAMAKIANDTKWDNATGENAKLFFNLYKSKYRDQDYYVVINKKNPSEKYQLHFGTNTFVDSEGDPIKLEYLLKKVPSLKNVLPVNNLTEALEDETVEKEVVMSNATVDTLINALSKLDKDMKIRFAPLTCCDEECSIKGIVFDDETGELVISVECEAPNTEEAPVEECLNEDANNNTNNYYVVAEIAQKVYENGELVGTDGCIECGMYNSAEPMTYTEAANKFAEFENATAEMVTKNFDIRDLDADLDEFYRINLCKVPKNKGTDLYPEELVSEYCFDRILVGEALMEESLKESCETCLTDAEKKFLGDRLSIELDWGNVYSEEERELMKSIGSKLGLELQSLKEQVTEDYDTIDPALDELVDLNTFRPEEELITDELDEAIKVDLAKVPGSMSYILQHNCEKWAGDNVKNAIDVYNAIKQLFEENGLDTPDSRRLLFRLSQKKPWQLADAILTAENSMDYTGMHLGDRY